LWLFRPDGKRRIQLTNDPATLDLHPAFSPDGRQIAFIRGSDSGGPNSLWVCTANGSDARQIVKASTSSERFLSPVWASTSRLCYVRDPAMDRRPDMEFWEVDPSGGSPKLVFRIQDSSVGGNGLVTSISPDGQQLAMAIQNGLLWTTADIYLTDWTGHVVHTLWEDDPDDRKDSRPLWSPDGKSIAWHHNYTRGAMSKTVYFGVGLARRDGEKGWRSELQPSREPRVTPLAWSPDSSGLLCARFSPETTQVELFIMDGRFQVQRELFGLDVPGWQPGQRDLARLRDFGRLADWARIPGEIVLPEGEGL
jgi:Tol biopolymer transport system component